MKAIMWAVLSVGLWLGAAAAEDAVPAEAFTVRPIGVVEKNDGRTTLVIGEEFTKGLLHLDRYSHVWVIWWLDRNDNPKERAVLRVIPRGNDDNGVAGVFATRSQYRPNLVAMTLCKIRAIRGNRVELEGIDAFDRTPVLDLKPYVPAIDRAEDVRTAGWKAPGKKQ